MNGLLSDYLKDNYPKTKFDLFSAFIERCSAMANLDGYYSLITPQAFMFLQSYESLRSDIIHCKTIVNMTHFGFGAFGADFGTAAYCVCNKNYANYTATYIRLSDFGNIDEKETHFSDMSNRYYAQQLDYLIIQDYPFAYWVSKAGLSAFSKGIMKKYADTKQGFKTSDNDRFLRYWYEVSLSKLFLGGCKDNKKWFPCNKGGDYRKWYGNNQYAVNWENDGFEIINFKDKHGKLLSRPQNLMYNFREALTWSTLSSGDVSFRYSAETMMFESKGSECFPKSSKDIWNILGFLNSTVAMYYFKMIAPTVDYSEGSVLKLPFIRNENEEINALVRENIQLSKSDWDSFETSWDFEQHPLI